jgi:lipid II:glycine glycyltransferase (peptidoglycan interpeptide bridge formation enzyme)
MRDRGAIVAGVQILERRVGRFVAVGYVPRGPLVSEGVDGSLVIAEMRRVARVRGLAYLAISLPYSAHPLVQVFEKAGIEKRPSRLPPAIWTKATVVINLEKDEDVILSEMSSSKRKQVRRGQRAAIVVREAGKSELRIFEELMLALCRRRGVSRNIPGDGFLELLWETFSPGGHIKLLIAERNNEAICAQLLMLDGLWARAWRIGWSGQDEKYCPNDVLYWESIRWAKQHRCRYFDVFGIDVDDASELLAGRDRSLPFKCPITYFKVGFGGRIMLLPGEFCDFPNPMARLAFRLGGRALLNSGAVGRILDRIHARSYERPR